MQTAEPEPSAADGRETGILRRAEIDRRAEKDLDRLAFFSDAIFAIAITLLVLRISVPAPGADLGQALIDRWPSFLMYVVSFYVIGQYWMKHHRMFRYIRRYDQRLMTLDLFLMLCIAFLPYPTELLGRHSTETVSVVFYAGTVVVTGLASTALWWYAGRHGFLDDELGAAQIRAFTRRGLIMLSVFVISIPLAFVDPTVATLTWAGGILMHPVDRLLTKTVGLDGGRG